MMQISNVYKRLCACCRTLFAAMLALALVLACAPARALAADDATVEQTLAGTTAAIKGVLDVSEGESIFAADKLSPGDSTSQWVAYEFYRLGLEKDPSAFVSSCEGFVTDAYTKDEQIDELFSTEWNRLSIILTGLGADPTSFGTDTAGNPIDLVADGSYNWTHSESIGLQGVNGWIYAIQAIDVTGVTVPKDAVTTQDEMIDELLELQEDDGGWGLMPGVSDTDLTAMSVTALAPHLDHKGVQAAVDKALAYMSGIQEDTGRFAYEAGASSETSSQVIMALCALGIDPRTDERFVKGGKSAFDGLLSFKREDGSFSHNDNDNLSIVVALPTEQATRACLAIYELDHGCDGNVYTADGNFELNTQARGGGAGLAGAGAVALWAAAGVAAALVVVAVLYIVWRIRRRRRA